MTCSRLVYFVLLLQIIVVQSVIQNVTRDKNGDIFLNPDKSCRSDSCRMYNGIAIGGSSWSDDNCECSCNYDKTFIVHNTTCVYDSIVRFNLRASLPTKDASFYVTNGDDCMPSGTLIEMPILDMTRSSKRTLCLVATDITNCKIIKKDSVFLYEGQWFLIWPANRKQDAFTITESDDISVLEWKALGQQFAGLIFALKISCQLTLGDTNTLGSYLLFKSAGWHYFDGVQPTLAPISSAPTHASKEPSSTLQPSSTASPSKAGKGKSSDSPADTGLIVGLTICAVLVLIVIIVLVVYHLRRKRNDEKPKEEAQCEANPTYDLGQDRTLAVTVNGQPPAYDYPDTSGGYQPLVQNTRMRDATGKVPVYTPLSRETKNNNSPVLQMKTAATGKRGLAYETVAVPIQQPTTQESPAVPESPEYEDPNNPTIPDEGGLYAVSRAQDDNTMDFENTEYTDPESVINIG